MKKFRRGVGLLVATGLVALLVSALLSGCFLWDGLRRGTEKPGEDKPPVNPVPGEDRVTVTLFFADSQAQYVIPEEREVVKGNATLEELIIQGLIDGPTSPGLGPTLPPGTRLLSLEVKEGVAYVNFSQEIQTRHAGGSAGEGMTIMSVVFSLTELPYVKAVQFMVEGKRVETLTGHADFTEPIGRGPIRTYPVFIDKNRVEALQRLVDQGRETWRLDPLKVARREGRMAAFYLGDRFELLSRVDKGEYSGTGEADVRAVHSGKSYILKLIQPIKTGPGGIWVINGIRPE